MTDAAPRFLARRVLALGVVSLLALACSEKKPPEKPVAQLVSSTGLVTLTRGESAEVPVAPGPLFAGDLIVTGQDGKAVLRSNEGRELELGESTRFRLGQKLGSVTLDLQAGSISLVGGEGADAPALAVTTPFGQTRVSAGSKAKLVVGEAGMAIDVALGVITVLGEDGGQQSASAGQKMNLSMGSIEIVDAPPPPPPPKPVVKPPPTAIELVLSPEAGTPMLKKKGAARFTPAPKTPEAIVAGTAFQLPKGARARLSTAGVELRLDSGSTGAAGDSLQDGDQRSVKLQLASGSALAQLGGGATSLSIGGSGKKEVQLKSSGEASVVVVQTPKGPKLEVRAGEVEVSSGGQTQVVKAGQLVDVSADALAVEARAKPGLVLPSDKKVRVYGDAVGMVGLSWPPVEGDAHVQVSASASFEELLVSGKVADPYVAAPAPAAGDLYWRVVGAGGAPLHQGHVRFDPDREGNQGKAENPRGDVAETGLRSAVYFQSALPSLTFTFAPREGVRKYRLKVFRADDLKKPLVDREVADTKGTVESGVLVEGSYVWYAAPLDEHGAESTGGRMNKLDILYDNSLTSLLIDHPKPGERGDGASAAGTAPLASTLYVNGKAVALDAKGRFSVPLTRADQVVFRLVERSGDERYWVRRLSRR